MKNIKKSYIKIFIFELFSLILLTLNVFKSSILMMYKTPLLLLILTFIFILILGIEKDKKRYTTDVIFETVRALVIFLILYYLSGIVITFARTNNYLTLYGISTILIPLVLTICFKEFLRNLIVTKCGNNKFLIAFTFFLFVMIDVTTSVSLLHLNSNYTIFLFIACTLLPAITTNILLMHLVKQAGYKASISYLLVLNLFQYIIPIVPNPTRYLKAMIDLLLPIVILLRIRKILYNPHSKKITSDIVKKNNYIGLIIPLTLTIILVYFVSGYFKHTVVAIVSGSMHPVFDRGDIVVVEQVKDKYKNKNIIQNGKIIAFKTSTGRIVVHRIIKEVKDKENIYYFTKGDFNKDIDDNIVEPKDIIGVVKTKIKYIGFPTVWLSEIWEGKNG